MGANVTQAERTRSQHGGQRRTGAVRTRRTVTGVRTLVLAVVHPVLGGVVVLSQTPALGRVGFIWNIMVLLLKWHLSGLL